FGGEYYDGAENLVFDDLLRWDPDAKQFTSDRQWTRILTPLPHPPPRCAHSAVHHNDCIYVFGGECATAEKYHHYRDLWKFDIKRNVWEECRSRGGNPPAARSGHRAVAWRHYMIVFGGFHEALRTETRWFNDIHIFDFQSSAWTELQYGKLARLPPARSACNMVVCTAPSEALFVYGGYSKLKNVNAPGGSKSEGIMHVDCWVLPLKSLVGGVSAGGANPPSWERISRKGEYPSPRAGTSSILHKNKMLLFGGVLDNEGDHHKMESVFYDDLFALDLERRRWFSMKLKKASGSVMKVDEKGVPVFVARQTPLPRINCATVVKGNTLYIYGGVLEVGDREVTLDDCWSIDLNKRDKWTCIWSGQMHKQVWKGVDSDNDSYISSDQGGDESDEDEFAEFEAIAEGDEGELDEEARKAAKKEAKRAAKKAAKAGIREEISSLKEQLGLDNDQRTPLMGENKADFYSRTTEYWNMEAVKTVGQAAADRGEALSSKELKREGFQLANDRFDELKPILDRLNELETMQQEAEE
ncbi:predicted protein, partial [Thalassiosira pseudonana CCMP1335]